MWQRAARQLILSRDEAELHIGLRTLDVEAAEHLKQRIPEVIDHYVKAWNGEYDLTIFHTPCTYSNEELCRDVVPHIGEIVGVEKVHQIPPMTGTEDFGYVTTEVPGMFVFIGAGKAGQCTASQSEDDAGRRSAASRSSSPCKCGCYVA